MVVLSMSLGPSSFISVYTKRLTSKELDLRFNIQEVRRETQGTKK